MNGNTPYAGLPGVTGAGQRADVDVPSLSRAQRRALSRDVSHIAARTREYLPDEYIVNSEISHGVGGPQVTVAVRPPIGRPVSAGFTPSPGDLDADVPDASLADEASRPEDDDSAPDEAPTDGGSEIIASAERAEVARGLAASAALQVKRAIGDDLTPTAR